MADITSHIHTINNTAVAINNNLNITVIVQDWPPQGNNIAATNCSSHYSTATTTMDHNTIVDIDRHIAATIIIDNIASPPKYIRHIIAVITATTTIAAATIIQRITVILGTDQR